MKTLTEGTKSADLDNKRAQLFLHHFKLESHQGLCYLVQMCSRVGLI